MNVLRKRIVFGLFFFGAFASGASNAVPISLDLEGSWGYTVGSEVPLGFENALDRSVFGAWSGSISVDPEEAALHSDVFDIDGNVVGHDYFDSTATARIRLANGTEATGTGALISVTFDERFGEPSYAIKPALSIPNAMFPGALDYAAWASQLGFHLSGVYGASDNPMRPPTLLDDLSVSVRGQICGDFDRNDLVLPEECVQLQGVGQVRASPPIVSVPEPGSLLLFLAGAAGLAAFRKPRLVVHKGSTC